MIRYVPLEMDFDEVHRYSLDEYHLLIESGCFDERTRVELIDGLLLDKGVTSREHENAIEWLAQWLFGAVDLHRFAVRVSAALTLERSEPEPDLFVVPRDALRPYHPGTASLVIEVSVSSQRRDLVRKPRIYAAAGVDEYWVVDLDNRRVVCHRDPRGDTYHEIAEIPADGALTAAAVELPALAVAELLAAADR